MFLGAAVLVALLFFGFIALAMGLSDSAPQATSSTLDVTLNEFSIGGQLTAPAGDVNLRLKNDGNAVHNIVARDLALGSGDIGPGGSGELALGNLAAGSYQIFCNIAGHEASGMVTDLVITAGGGAAADAGHTAAPTAAAAHEDSAAQYAKMDQDMIDTIKAFPAETKGKGNPVLAPTTVEADGTKVFDLTAEIIDWEVEPGKIVKAWTYNGIVPGP